MTALAPPQPTRTAALVAYDLWKLYGDRPVVQGVGFSLYPGEVLGLLGPNGAGKTTTVGMLYGAVAPPVGLCKLAQRPFKTMAEERGRKWASSLKKIISILIFR